MHIHAYGLFNLQACNMHEFLELMLQMYSTMCALSSNPCTNTCSNALKTHGVWESIGVEAEGGGNAAVEASLPVPVGPGGMSRAGHGGSGAGGAAAGGAGDVAGGFRAVRAARMEAAQQLLAAGTEDTSTTPMMLDTMVSTVYIAFKPL